MYECMFVGFHWIHPWISFGSLAIFTILILLFHECGKSFHLLVSSQVFSSEPWSFHCRSLSYTWLGFLPGIYLFFCSYCEVDYFPYFFFQNICHWCTIRVLNWFFCMLIWYCVTLLKVFIRFKSVLVLWIPVYRIISSALENALTSPFPGCITFISFHVLLI